MLWATAGDDLPVLPELLQAAGQPFQVRAQVGYPGGELREARDRDLFDQASS